MTDHERQTHSEVHTLISRMNPALVMDNTTSQPRDCLQSERTVLSFVRFASTLAFTSVALILNFRFDTASKSADDNGDQHKNTSYTKAVSSILIALALSTLVVAGINYSKTINHYANNTIKTFNSIPTAILITCIVVVLLAVNVSLLVEGYR